MGTLYIAHCIECELYTMHTLQNAHSVQRTLYTVKSQLGLYKIPTWDCIESHLGDCIESQLHRLVSLEMRIYRCNDSLYTSALKNRVREIIPNVDKFSMLNSLTIISESPTSPSGDIRDQVESGFDCNANSG